MGVKWGVKRLGYLMGYLMGYLKNAKIRPLIVF